MKNQRWPIVTPFLSAQGGAVRLRVAGRSAPGKSAGGNLQSRRRHADSRANDRLAADLGDRARFHHPAARRCHATQVGAKGGRLISRLTWIPTFALFLGGGLFCLNCVFVALFEISALAQNANSCTYFLPLQGLLGALSHADGRLQEQQR